MTSFDEYNNYLTNFILPNSNEDKITAYTKLLYDKPLTSIIIAIIKLGRLIMR